MQRSEQINELAAALAKAQANIKGAVKDSANPFFKSRYADLTSVWDACRSALTDNGLAIIQTARTTEGGVAVETALVHQSGQMVSEVLELPAAKMDAQGIGSAITYARRYALASIAGVCPEDDDGNAAVSSVNASRAKLLEELERAALDGTGALEAKWKVLTNPQRESVKDAMGPIKAKAAKVKEAAHV